MTALRLRRTGPLAACTAALVLLAGCSAGDGEDPGPATSSAPAPEATKGEPGESDDPTDTDETDETDQPAAYEPRPISLAALAQADLTGGGLRLGAVRERTATYTSYDVTFRSRSEEHTSELQSH